MQYELTFHLLTISEEAVHLHCGFFIIVLDLRLTKRFREAVKLP